MRTTVRQGTAEDALSLIPRLRIADLRECILLGGPDVETSVLRSVEGSDEVWVGEAGGKVIALGGVAFRGSKPGTLIGAPWLIGSDELLDHKRQLLLVGRVETERWLAQCDILCNFVHADNTAHIEWLKRIGYTMGKTIPSYGHGGAPFTFFSMMKKPCA